MLIDINSVSDIVPSNAIITDKETLHERYCKPIIRGNNIIPIAAVFPKNTEQISKLFKHFRKVKDVNVVIISSQTSPKFLNDTISFENTIIVDLSNMKGIPVINRRNRVCVVEPGVTFTDLIPKLREHGMRPLAPFLPRYGKSVLASALDREPHMVPKKQWDISDPLLCIEVVFGNGEIFRTGEAAGPQSIEKNKEFGAALTNPLGPGQMDIFRIIQGSKGTYGAVTWASIQCDEIPEKRIIKFIESDSIESMVEFIYYVVRRRWVDEIFIINKNLFKNIFPSMNGTIKKYIMLFSINGYEKFLPEEKVSYQLESCNEFLEELKLEAKDRINNITSHDIEPILDGNSLDPSPKSPNKTIAIDVFYNTTLDRLQNQIFEVEEIIKNHSFPFERVNIYIQPVIQARSVNLEFSLLADRPDSNSQSYTIEKVQEICKEIANRVALIGGFFSRSYKLINEVAFSDHNEVYQEALLKLKRIFDPDNILNKGELIF